MESRENCEMEIGRFMLKMGKLLNCDTSNAQITCACFGTTSTRYLPKGIEYVNLLIS